MSTKNQNILLVEDEDDLAEIVKYHLSREGYSIFRTATGQDSLEYLRQNDVSLILLDLMLPDMSGVDICKQVRQNINTKNIPIIMVTAKGEEIDRVVGFEVGADDYVVKPFSSRELILRVKALLRRQGPQESLAIEKIYFEVFHIDKSAHRVWIEDEEIILTALEFKLLTFLLERRGLVQTREKLLERVWEIDPNVNTRTAEKHVQRLRQKIGVGPDYSETISGVGCRLKNGTTVKF